MRLLYEARRIADLARALLIERRLAGHDAWPPDRIAREQQRAFGEILRHAVRASRFYRRLYRGIPIEDVTWPDRLPVIDKAQMMAAFDDVVTDPRITWAGVERHLRKLTADDYFLGRYRALTTSGTSGIRGTFLFDRREWAIELANALRWQRMIGVRPRFPDRLRMSTVGADVPLHVSRRLTESGNAGLFRMQQLSVTRPLAELVRELNAFEPEVLLPYATMAGVLAREQLEGRLDIHPRIVSTHSEPLSPEAAARVRSAWGVTALDHYGLTEISTLAAACREHGSLHALNDLFIAEVVDDAHRPVPAGETGRKLLITNLYNRTQPIIRYEVSDMLAMASEPCPCGRPFPVIARIEGRREECLELPTPAGGRTVVAPLVLVTLLDERAEIAAYRITHDPRLIRIEVAPRAGVPPEPLRAAIAEQVYARIAALGAVPPAIEVVVTAAIPGWMAHMGKSRLVTGRGSGEG